jgi:hypothetical protein
MKVIFITCFFIISFSCYSQKVSIDKTDPFTNIRTLISSPLYLKKVGMNNILISTIALESSQDSIQKIRLSFIIPIVTTQIITADSTKPGCLLKLESNSVIECIYESDAKVNALGKFDHVFNFIIEKKYLNNLESQKVTAVKFFNSINEGGVFEIDNGAQDKISKAIIVLLSKIIK